MIIDEINRANLSSVFGELMYLLEYREQAIQLAGGTWFEIPGNVRLIGTMNTADRSIALVDHALRRRFAFIQLSPNYHLLARFHDDSEFPMVRLIDELKAVNRLIDDPHYEIGVAFFLRRDLSEQFGSIWQTEIEPYLEEYFFSQPDRITPFRWQQVKERLSK
jgi:5-methylcytosine-specific restriction protein B